MAELNFNRGSFYGIESADEPPATVIEIADFKKQYDAMTDAEKARLPIWLCAQLDQM